MKARILSLATFMLSMFASMDMTAVPAKPGLITMRQADGTEIKIRLIGDEYHHYYLTEDGYLLINKDDTFFYGNIDGKGNIVSSQIIATPAEKRTEKAKKYLETVDMDKVTTAMKTKATSKRMAKSPQKAVGLFQTGFPSKGVQKGLVILVEYKDTKFTLSDPHDYFNRMLNENGFNDYGGTGCAAEYFRTSSRNQFLPEFDVFGPVTLSQNMSYYGGNNWTGDDQNPEKMAIEACQQLDATVNFAEYDRDNDGYIDNVFIFYAGRGEASGGSANTVWPHSWNITAATDTPYIFDGVILDRYACSNEWEGSRPDGVGTFIHEFSHVMGLPDLYATSYTSAFTPGAWSVLDYGPYNNEGRTPPLYSIYERYSLGWMNPTVLDGPKNVVLGEISGNNGCIIKTEKENEFFLFENRQQKGWDKYIPGHGMLVWHVDFNENVWAQNTVNNTSAHQYVDLEEADGTQNEYSRDGDAFPGTSNITSFTDDTRPSMKSWSGHRQGLPITDIKENNGIITFSVAGGAPPVEPVTAHEATDITPVSFKANWTQSDNKSDTYKISVYTKTSNDNGREFRTYVDGYYMLNTEDTTSVTVTGLAPLTQYYYVIYAVNNDITSEESNEIAVTTAPPTFEFLKPVALNATDITDSSFTANWKTMDEATEYFIEVYTKIYGEPEYKDSVDFTGGVTNLPEGWKTNSTQSYANKSYSGKAIPSLRFIQTGNYIESPQYMKPIRRLSFWHRGSQAAEDNSLIVSVLTKDNKWSEVASVSIENGAGGVINTIDSIPEDTYKLRITYNMPGKGAVAIDDIMIEYGGEVESVLEKRKKIAAPAESIIIDCLTASATYYYCVQATDGERVSERSNEIRVKTMTKINTSIDRTVGTKAALNLSGDILNIDGVNGDAIVVADVYGRRVFATDKSYTDNVTVRLPSQGIYIIRIGQSRAIKIKR
ncbi:M6 family metalloprotease domain-containing protein [Xylanibacter muris]|uniref:M6 family metalloprotease domain-containing protein n=1 Tax=Xylanibacter muris TaxID=2736290 RepID=A0ABX2AJG5_9BACT|nr:M6 family metalloprotease domain-containing protein [Xylanibacter muris]NPD91278.1 M6 family metalloprotease domain-containing protein [Xylanibacter muris]